MYLVFSATVDEARDYLQHRYQRGVEDHFTTTIEMIEFLSDIYVDPHARSKAKSEYRKLEMGEAQSFHEYRSQFTALANKARIALADRVEDLYLSLTPSLQRALMKDRYMDNFNEFCTVAASADTESRRINKL